MTLGSLPTLATDLTSCFVIGIVVILVDTTDVVELETLIVSLIGSFLLGAEVVNESLVVQTLDVLGHFVKVPPGGFFDGKVTEIIAVGCKLTVAVLVTEAVGFEASVNTCPVDARLLKEADELTEMELVTVIVFDNCDVVAVEGELFTALVTVLLVNKVLPRPAPGLKSLELLTIVAKLGSGPCSTAMLVGTLCTGLLTMELGTGNGML